MQHISEVIYDMFRDWPEKPLVDEQKETERQARIRERYNDATK